jgi:hypothetical protein
MASSSSFSDYLPIVFNLEQVESGGLCANTHIKMSESTNGRKDARGTTHFNVWP